MGKLFIEHTKEEPETVYNLIWECLQCGEVNRLWYFQRPKKQLWCSKCHTLHWLRKAK